MATRKIGTRRKPTSPLYLGVLDPEQILKEARKIQKSQSSPYFFTHNQLDLVSPCVYSEEEKQNLSWLVPSTPINTFHIFTNPQACQKVKTEVPGKTPLF